MSCRTFCVTFTYQCFRVLFKLITAFMVYVFKRDGVPRRNIEDVKTAHDTLSKEMESIYKKCVGECCEDK